MTTPAPHPDTPIVYCNGVLCPVHEARISPLDRGFLFGHGIYEGLRTIPDGDGVRIVGFEPHLARLRLGLDAIRCGWDTSELRPLVERLIEANGLRDAFVYVHVTEGVPPAGSPLRRRLAPDGTTPIVFAFCEPVAPLDPESPPTTRSAITVRDARWMIGHLKSTSLTANVMACEQARDAGVDDLLFVRDGRLVEGSTTNALLVTPDGTLVTPSLDSGPMLDGVTRRLLLEACPEIEERPVASSELDAAREILLVGTNTIVASVVSLDGRSVGDGTPGPQAVRLRRALIDHILRGA